MGCSALYASKKIYKTSVVEILNENDADYNAADVIKNRFKLKGKICELHYRPIYREKKLT